MKCLHALNASMFAFIFTSSDSIFISVSIYSLTPTPPPGPLPLSPPCPPSCPHHRTKYSLLDQHPIQRKSKAPHPSNSSLSWPNSNNIVDWFLFSATACASYQLPPPSTTNRSSNPLRKGPLISSNPTNTLSEFCIRIIKLIQRERKTRYKPRHQYRAMKKRQSHLRQPISGKRSLILPVAGLSKGGTWYRAWSEGG